MKTGEVAVGRAEGCAVLNRNRRQRRVHHERAGRLTTFRESSKDFPVPFAGLEHAGDGLRQPTADNRSCVRHRQRALEIRGFVEI